MARAAARVAGWSVGVRLGLPPWSGCVVTVTPAGATAATWSLKAARILSGSWLATRRAEILACACAGMIVLPPSPWNPLHMPLTSSVGRADLRSSVDQPASPTSAGTGIEARNASSSNGSAAMAARSAAVSATTSS